MFTLVLGSAPEAISILAGAALSWGIGVAGGSLRQLVVTWLAASHRSSPSLSRSSGDFSRVGVGQGVGVFLL